MYRIQNLDILFVEGSKFIPKKAFLIKKVSLDAYR